MTTVDLSVTATMLIGIDRFVAPAENGLTVLCSDRRVQPWLCGEALLGGALWALCADEVVDLDSLGTLPGSAPPRSMPRRAANYPPGSLEARLVAALSDRPERVADTLRRALDFTGAQPWRDITLAVYGEISDAGYLSVTPLTRNGSTPGAQRWGGPRYGFVAPDCVRLAALTPAVDRLSDRWDRWWAGKADALSAVARTCRAAIRSRRLEFARQLCYGLPVHRRPFDPAEADAERVRSHCPRWARHI